MYKLVICLSFLTLACGGKKSPSANTEGRHAASTDGGINFVIQDLEGREVQLADYRGKTVLLNIWATWCGPCKREIPDLNEIHKEYADKDVVVIGVLLESGPPEQAKKVVESEFTIDYPTWYGNAQLARQFEVIGFPLTVIIDKEGKVRNKMLGAQTKKTFLNALKDVGA